MRAPPERSCGISGAQNLIECLNSFRATGPWVCKNCRWCGSTSAPGFAEQTLPVRMLSGRSQTGPYEIATASGYAVGAAHLGRPPRRFPRPPRRFPRPPCRARQPRRAAGGGVHHAVGHGLLDAPLRWFPQGVSPPAGGEFLSQRWERNQRTAGERLRMSAPRSYSPFPRSPVYEGPS